MKADISVVLCTYNGAAYLREQLDSLLRQTLPATEIILRDDASTDNTWAVVESYVQQYPQIKAQRNAQNLGFKQNFAQALQDAQGDFIAYCDQDDIWTDHHLEVFYQLIGEQDLAVCNALLVDKQARSLGFSLREEFAYRK
jgi:glycosyltransferase involved in cell wall biosynthesis